MGRKNKRELEIRIDQMSFKGVSGLGPRGKRWTCRGAALGDLVRIREGRKNKGTLLEVIEKSASRVAPQCQHFLICGGCQFQHMSLTDQRRAKQAMIERLFEGFDGDIHPIRGDDQGYGYRNKLELSFGKRKFYPVAPAEKPADGSHLGMHPWGWYSKIVPLKQCCIASSSIDQAVELLSMQALEPAWDTYQHKGVWRHVVLREGGGLSINLVTSSEATRGDVLALTETLKTLPGLRGVLWTINDGLAEVAIGELREVLYGRADLEITVNGKSMLIPHDGFAQVNDGAAAILFECILEASGENRGTLLDLYCGSGAIGIALSEQFNQIIGVEIQEQAIGRARENAQRNRIDGNWIAGAVEDVLKGLEWDSPATIIVDPPRDGLHPKAARFLAGRQEEILIYVACNPKSLARDKEILETGNWRMDALWMVDLFPQTPHTECIGRFVPKT